jgi:LL-diaminopimelate aminotransferase
MRSEDRTQLSNPGVFADLARHRQQRLAAGLPVIDLSIGSPDLAPPVHVRQALAEAAMDPSQYGYALNDHPGLRQAAADWYRKRFMVELDPDTEIVSLLGSQDGLMHVTLALLTPGDTVLVPEPCYPAFAAGPMLAGARIYPMPLLARNGYLIDFAAIPREVARTTKFMLVSYPNNPTTAVAPTAFYDTLVAFAHEHSITVLHDNAYSEICFDGAHGGSFLAHAGAKAIGIEFNSLSKPYGLPGARIGFCMGNRDVCRRLALLKSNIDYGMFLPIQAAAIAALTGDQACVAQARAIYRRRRDVLCDGLRTIGWEVTPPGGTIFVWARLPGELQDSRRFCEELLSRAGVMVTPGRAFGALGEGYVRLALVQDEETLRQAVRAIGESGLIRRG